MVEPPILTILSSRIATKLDRSAVADGFLSSFLPSEIHRPAARPIVDLLLCGLAFA